MFGSIDNNYVALSDPMFVHNNSKYRSEMRPVTTKPPKLLRLEEEDKSKQNKHTIICLIFLFMPDLKPRIIAVFPSEGWTGGGRDICIIGESFSNGMQLIFGSQQVPCKVKSSDLMHICMYSCHQQIISSNALSVTVPRRSIPGEVFITVFANGEHYCTDSPGIYKYLGNRIIKYNYIKIL